MTPPQVPDRAQVVVVGGGIIGCSVAYHLAEMGWKDVVVLERDRLTSGSTWHAAGLLVTFGSLSDISMDWRIHTKAMANNLEAETEQATGFMPVGFVELAADRDRLEEYRRVAAFNRYKGIDVHEIGPDEVKKLFPMARTDDILAGFYVEDDGRVNPVDFTMAIAKGAKMKGARILEEVPVIDVLHKGGRVTGVKTAQGDIEAEYVVNCAGVWARQLGAKHGVNIPCQAAEHYYLITEPIDGISINWPVIEDPSCHGYYREEGGGLMIGLFEPKCAPWRLDGVPEDFSFGSIQPDWDRMTPYVERAMSRVPVSTETGIKLFFCGPESFTADLAPIVGESRELRNYFVGAGLNSVGITTGCGMGRMIARWIVDGKPNEDCTPYNIDRLQLYHNTREYRAQRTVESLGMVYQAHYPTRPMVTARNAKRSPFHDRMAAHGAYFRDVSGFEEPDWYAPEGTEPETGELSWGRMHWWPYWEAEHRACREGVILMDMSFMCKFLLAGRDAGKVINQIAANDVATETGMIVYTQFLNEDGKVEADLTVTKLAEDRYWIVATDTGYGHVETWIQRHIPEDAHAFLTDVTGGYGQLNIQGPRSRELMELLTSSDMSNEAYPFRTARYIDIGLARALCIRITYLGELGYELYIPAEQCTYVYDRIVEIGEAKVDLKHAGLKALASLRMEKGYRDYGHDIDNTDTVLEVGLGFAVALDKPGGFIGREAVATQKAEKALFRRLLQVRVLDPEPLMYHAEVVYRDDVAVGYIRTASYGHTLGGAVGLVMANSDEPIKKKFWTEGKWEVDIAGKRYPAVASLRPMYDPTMERIRA